MKKNIQLCTNALRLEEMLDRFTPNPRLTWVVHLDGMREIARLHLRLPGPLGRRDRGDQGGPRRAASASRRTRRSSRRPQVDDVIEMMRFLTKEVGIDGMLVAPGYQYSQIDPNLTMTRAEHEEKFRADPRGRPQARLQVACEPDLPGLPDRRADARVHALGLDHAQPLRLEGPVLPAHRRHLPDLRGADGRDGVGALRARATTLAASTARSTAASSPRPPSRRPPASRRPCGASRGRCAEPAHPGLRARGRGGAARRAGARTARSASPPRGRCPDGRARQLRPGRRARAGPRARRAVTATKVVDETARCSGRGAARTSPARDRAVICAAGRVVDEPARARAARRAHGRGRGRHGERRARARAGGWPASSGRSPTRPSARSGGSPAPRRPTAATAWGAVARAFLTEPVRADPRRAGRAPGASRRSSGPPRALAEAAR